MENRRRYEPFLIATFFYQRCGTGKHNFTSIRKKTVEKKNKRNEFKKKKTTNILSVRCRRSSETPGRSIDEIGISLAIEIGQLSLERRQC